MNVCIINVWGCTEILAKKIISCRFEGKKTKDEVTNLPWMTLFSSRLESAEGKSSERRFKVHFVCFFL